jgi:phospholipase D1/2
MASVPPEPKVEIDRTVRQLCMSDGTPYKGYATSCVWVSESDPYPKTDGNSVTPLLTGENYYEQLADAIAQAKESVYMLGWQINWDVMLKPAEKLRLYDAILKATSANPQLSVYVLPWDDSAPVTTGDDETVAVLKSINAQLKGKPQVFARIAVEHPDASAGMDMFYSHHQKQVVIDNRIAFVGGIDVCYGRRDGNTFPLDAKDRLGNDAYNGCVPRLLPVKESDYVQGLNAMYVQPSSGNRQVPPGMTSGNPYDALAQQTQQKLQAGKVEYPTGGMMLDATRQPRMPWQDVHLRIEGPAASDLASNFVLRWNTAKGSGDLALPAEAKTYPKAGSCSVQMLRSASRTMVDLEAKNAKPADRPRVHQASGHNHNHHAMVRLIEHADHFIYIENQFFTSAFGTPGFGDAASVALGPSQPVSSVTTRTAKWGSRAVVGDADALPTNKICEALGTKLKDVILNVGNSSPDGKTSNFHIYITLPVHSEGLLNDPAVMTQVHYTQQTLVFGSQSLVNRTRRAIKARQLLDKKEPDYLRVFEDKNEEYKDVPIDYCWAYITLLNLRTWAKLGESYVTEQVYIHTKMMVVDDRYAIVGSANVNDRSLLGNRDSELAVLVMDTDFKYEDIGAPDGATVTRKFARELRRSVWKKIFGITGGERPANGLQAAIDKPAAQKSWEAIQQQAEKNSERYSAAFPFIPRNPSGGTGSVASIWPTIQMENGKRVSGLMPFDEAFWNTPQHAPAAAQLVDVKGYLTLLPHLWTQGENNNSGMHSALFVDNADRPASPPIQQALNDPGMSIEKTS